MVDDIVIRMNRMAQYLEYREQGPLKGPINFDIIIIFFFLFFRFKGKLPQTQGEEKGFSILI